MDRAKVIKESVDKFLIDNCMHELCTDFESQSENFLHEMTTGLMGKEKSLQMLPSFIDFNTRMETNKRVIVIDAGGTNLRVACVYYDAFGKMLIEYYMSYPMPGSIGKTDKKTFFSSLAGYLMPIIEKSDRIGFCFSFPSRIYPNKDGEIISFSKEITIYDSQGCFLGEELNEQFKMRGISKKKITVINDSVATLLSGMIADQDRTFNSHVGFVYGTGINTAYIEQIPNISKLERYGKLLGEMAVNIESGRYSGFQQGTYDRELDMTTSNPTQYTFEKMVSGRYLGNLILRCIKGAAYHDLMSADLTDKIKNCEVLELREVDQFLLYPEGKNTLSNICIDQNDRIAVIYIIEALYERAAKLIAISFDSVFRKINRERDANNSVCITVEGSSFYKSLLIKPKLEYYLKNRNNKNGAYYEIIKVQEATLIGAAVAALTSNNE